MPILKQINKHNEDGSYSYGYEAADGTYKIETKYSNGEVYGKYGYFDDQGQLREVEYGASRRGFEPAGSEITVAPPTVNNNNYPPAPLGPDDEDDGQYREDPSVYYQNEQNRNQRRKNYQQQQQPQPQPQQQPVYTPRYTNVQNNNNYQQQPLDDLDDFLSRPLITQKSFKPPRPKYQQQSYQQPAYERPSYQPQPQQYQPQFRPTTHFGFQNQQPSYNPPPPPPPPPQPVYNPPPQPAYNNYNNYNSNFFPKDPNTNIDYNTGSYSVNYK